MGMELQRGMLVEHPGRPEWGPGKVVHVDGPKVHVIFRDLADRKARILSTMHVELTISPLQSDPLLDNLPQAEREGGGWVIGPPNPVVTFQAARERFLQEFPGGFEDARYIKDERNYKVEAHERFERDLGGGRLGELLADGNVAEAARLARGVAGAVNLLSPFESAAFRDAMQEEAPAGRFLSALRDVLAAPEVTQEVFGPYAKAVNDLPHLEGKSRVATWPVATILPALAQPGRHMFLKPQFTRDAAERLRFDLRYRPDPGWATYEALLRLGRTYLDLLSDMGPRDFLDIQSFIYVACGGYDALPAQKAPARKKAASPRARLRKGTA